MAGDRDRLFVVRELDSYIGLQASNFTRQFFLFFSEKIIRKMRDSIKQALQNVEDVSSHVDPASKVMFVCN